MIISLFGATYVGETHQYCCLAEGISPSASLYHSWRSDKHGFVYRSTQYVGQIKQQHVTQQLHAVSQAPSEALHYAAADQLTVGAGAF